LRISATAIGTRLIVFGMATLRLATCLRIVGAFDFASVLIRTQSSV
jgi:hypothetical protein